MVSDDPIIWHFNLIFGSSRIPSSAYQKWAKKEFLKIHEESDVQKKKTTLLLRPI